MAAKSTPETRRRRAGDASLPDLLRELASLLVHVPGAEQDGPGWSRAGVSIERTAQVAGLQALLLPLLTAPLLALVPPTAAIGKAGWLPATAGLAVVVAIGFRLVRPPVVSGAVLAATNAFAAAVLGLLAWLSGGFESPFPLLLILVAASIAPHPPRLRRALLAWVVLVAALPMLYDDPSRRDLAEALMIAATSVGTLLTMVWLSSRVRRSEIGLMDAASVARRERATAEQRAGRLEELDEIRDRLVSRVSHELRTPLTSIKGYLEALLEGESGDLGSEQHEYASVALRNTVRLERLIGDLLLLSRVEAGQLELRREELDLGETLSRLSDELEPLARRRDITLAVSEAGGLRVVADPDRLDQAMTNLISNAIKYSPEGSPVSIRARSAGSEVVLEVIDQGVGIPTPEIDQIGDRFFRASTAGDVKGTGLGIAITRELIELHGGSLEIESAEGSGSTFRLRLPARPARG